MGADGGFVTPRRSSGSGPSRSHQRGATCGSAPTRGATSRPSGSMPRGGSSTSSRALARAKDREKFDRMIRFARGLPGVRRKVEKELRAPGLGRERALACAITLDRGVFRLGGEEYAEENETYRNRQPSQAPRQAGRRRRDPFRLPVEGREAPAAGHRRPARLRGGRGTEAPASGNRAARLPQRSLGGAEGGRRERAPEGPGRRGIHGEGLPDLARDGHSPAALAAAAERSATKAGRARRPARERGSRALPPRRSHVRPTSTLVWSTVSATASRLRTTSTTSGTSRRSAPQPRKARSKPP